MIFGQLPYVLKVGLILRLSWQSGTATSAAKAMRVKPHPVWKQARPRVLPPGPGGEVTKGLLAPGAGFFTGSAQTGPTG